MTSVVSIILDDNSFSLTEIAGVTIVSSEGTDPTTLGVLDFEVGSGTQPVLTKGDDGKWTAIFTPNATTQSTANTIPLTDNSFSNLAVDPGIGARNANFVVDTSVLALSSLDGRNGFVLNGIDIDDYSGLLVSGAGDMNGDGYDDILIGAYGAGPNGNDLFGESYVVFGQASGFGASFDLSTLNGSNGFVLNGSDYSGSSVSNAGDVNGDGYDDILIGAYRAGPNGNDLAGESYVVFGQASGFGASFDLSTLNGSNGFVLNGVDIYDYSGFSVSSAGDVNGDGYDDILIGAYAASPNGNAAEGESYVVFGQASGFAASFDLSTLNGSNGFVLEGIESGDYSGMSVSGAGDVNGDGYDDILIGADRANPNGYILAGESYVVFGQASGFSASFDLSTLNGSNGFVVEGVDFFDFSGGSVSGVGDINGDGYDDIIIGTNSDAGESYIIFGSADFIPQPLMLFGTSEADTLIGGAGSDTIDAGDGDDTVNGGPGADTMDGGNGIDTLSYAGSDAGVVVNLIMDTAMGGHATGDVISNFEGVEGSSYDDTIYANNTDHSFAHIFGGDGTDTLYLTSESNVTHDFRANGLETAFVQNAAGDTLQSFTKAVNGDTELQTFDVAGVFEWSRSLVRTDVSGSKAYSTLTAFYLDGGTEALDVVIQELDMGNRRTTDYDASDTEPFGLTIFTEDANNDEFFTSVLQTRNEAGAIIQFINKYDSALEVHVDFEFSTVGTEAVSAFDIVDNASWNRKVTNIDTSADGSLLTYQTAETFQNSALQNYGTNVLDDDGVRTLADFDLDGSDSWAVQFTRTDEGDNFTWGTIIDQRDASGNILYLSQTNDGSYDTINVYDVAGTDRSTSLVFLIANTRYYSQILGHW